jgi:hypothetical protein
MTERKLTKKVGVSTSESIGMIQGLYSLDPEGYSYYSLLAKVVLSKFRTQEKEPEKPGLILRHCRDCGDPHETGSQIFYECPIDHRWRTSAETCVYPTIEKEAKT